MDEIQKLKILLPHWMEHNDEHAKTYKEWAERMSCLGKKEFAEALEAIHRESQKLRRAFEDALRVIDH